MTDATPVDTVDLSDDDHLIEQSDNSGEDGQPVLDQDPTHIPEGSVR